MKILVLSSMVLMSSQAFAGAIFFQEAYTKNDECAIALQGKETTKQIIFVDDKIITYERGSTGNTNVTVIDEKGRANVVGEKGECIKPKNNPVDLLKKDLERQLSGDKLSEKEKKILVQKCYGKFRFFDELIEDKFSQFHSSSGASAPKPTTQQQR